MPCDALELSNTLNSPYFKIQFRPWPKAEIAEATSLPTKRHRAFHLIPSSSPAQNTYSRDRGSTWSTHVHLQQLSVCVRQDDRFSSRHQKKKKTILHNQLDLCYTRAYTKSRVEEERDGKGIEANTDGMTCVRAYMCARAEERVQHNTTYHVHHKSATDVDCRQRAQLWLCVCVQH